MVITAAAPSESPAPLEGPSAAAPLSELEPEPEVTDEDSGLQAYLARVQQRILDEIHTCTLCDYEAALKVAAAPEAEEKMEEGGGCAAARSNGVTEMGAAPAQASEACRSHRGLPQMAAAPPQAAETRSQCAPRRVSSAPEPTINRIFLGPLRQSGTASSRFPSRGPPACELDDPGSVSGPVLSSRSGTATARAPSASAAVCREAQTCSGVPLPGRYERVDPGASDRLAAATPPPCRAAHPQRLSPRTAIRMANTPPAVELEGSQAPPSLSGPQHPLGTASAPREESTGITGWLWPLPSVRLRPIGNRGASRAAPSTTTFPHIGNENPAAPQSGGSSLGSADAPTLVKDRGLSNGPRPHLREERQSPSQAILGGVEQER